MIIQFEKQLSGNEKLVLYGFGNVGRLLLHYYSNYFERVYDRNYSSLSQKYGIEIFSPNIINREKRRRVIVTCLGHEKEVNMFLREKGLTRIFNFDI